MAIAHAKERITPPRVSAAMARKLKTPKLKTYVADIGFYQAAVAAPSMKAALAAWGLTHNAFHQGRARQTGEAAAVAAAMAQPGMVLRRPLHSKGAFKQTPDLPRVKGAKPAAARKKAAPNTAKIRATEAALEKAKTAHAARQAALAAKAAAIDQASAAEDQAWQKTREMLEARLRRLVR